MVCGHAAIAFRSPGRWSVGPGTIFWIPMHRGYIKLWRCFERNAFANKPECVSLWLHMLCMANYTEKKVVLGGKVVTLQPGQFATSRKSLSARVGISENKTERLLSLLKSEQQIKQQSFSKFRIITITNWDKYQNSEQQNEQQIDSSQTANRQQLDTNKKERIKECKKSKKTDSVPNGTVSSELDRPHPKQPAEEIIERLNSATGKQFRADSKKTITLISARIREGFCVDDFFRVIDNKAEKWLGDPKMVDFLRPETLFGTKFESYLNEREAKPGRLKGVVSEKTERTITNLQNWSPPNV